MIPIPAETPAEIRRALRALGVRPRKGLGQSFLADRWVAEQIAEAAGIEPDETVLEVGPGLGILTHRLAGRASRVVAIESERALAEALRQAPRSPKNIEIHEGDALEADFAEIARRAAQPLRLVSNIPYAITTPLLLRLVDQRQAFRSWTLLLQAEFAERLTAEPGTKAYGRLTVLVRLLADGWLVFRVPADRFTPKPRVDSALVRLDLLARPRHPIRDDALLRRLLRAAFGQRRKMLRSALRSGFAEAYPAVERAMKNEKIDPRRRGETLSVKEFAELSNAIAEELAGGGGGPE